MSAAFHTVRNTAELVPLLHLATFWLKYVPGDSATHRDENKPPLMKCWALFSVVQEDSEMEGIKIRKMLCCMNFHSWSLRDGKSEPLWRIGLCPVYLSLSFWLLSSSKEKKVY